MLQRHPLLLIAAASLALTACSSDPDSEGSLDGLQIVGDDPTDIPLRGAEAAQVDRFYVGDALFDAVLRESDGLGPLYIRTACSSCHAGASRGPGAVQKMALVEADGVTPAPDQSGLMYGHTLKPYLTAGATKPIEAPTGSGVKLSQRLGPAVFGRGYMEAVADSEIERMESEQAKRTDGIHGRINRVIFPSKANPDQPFHTFKEGQDGIIGRFGMKGRSATLDDFTADAFQGDMGITSPMRTSEPANPEGLMDDSKPGIDITLETINAIADYTRLIELPRRGPSTVSGAELFEKANCSVCHAPSLKTRDDYPIKALAGIDAPLFTDFLLHEMGPDLADGLTDGEATSGSWKTAPLIGMRHLRGYMHDGRASTIEQAILLHGGAGSEAAGSASIFQSMSYEQQADLIAYVRSL